MPDNSHRNVAHQIGVKTPQIYENSKVKFIPCEEAALLSRGRPAVHYSRRFVAHRSLVDPPNMKPSSSMKSILPGRQVHPSSPRSMKQSCSMKCGSPSRSDGQAFSLKRCADASQNPIKVDDTRKRQKVQSGIFTHLVP